jgi:hypothetical protein
MFHRAGFRGEEALLRAQEATNTAMGDYHPDERPMIYSSMGELGHMIGALSTFKHNFVEQLANKTGNTMKGKQMAAGAAMVGIGLGLYGIGGFPGMQDASDMSQKLTGKSLRELVLADPDKPNSLLDGWASAKSGMDFQSRLSQSQMLPDSPLSAAPHVAWWANTFTKAFVAARDQDIASLKDLGKAVAPVGTHGLLDKYMSTDEAGDLVNSKGQKKYPPDFKRDITDIRMRAALGLKPIKERIYDENTYTMSQRNKQVEDKIKDINKRLIGVVNNNESLNPLIKEYAAAMNVTPAIAAQELMTKIDKIKLDAGRTPRDRLDGELGDSVNSIRKHNAYTY